jgi:hypothetical protein
MPKEPRQNVGPFPGINTIAMNHFNDTNASEKKYICLGSLGDEIMEMLAHICCKLAQVAKENAAP